MVFYDPIWNHHEKYIQISTNMPGTGSLFLENFPKTKQIYPVKPMGRPHAKCFLKIP